MGLGPLIQDLLRLEISIFVHDLNKLKHNLKKWIRINFQIILWSEIPIYFIAFLTEVISHAIMAKETNQNIDLVQVTSNPVRKRLEIIIASEQLKSFV